jgi:hypothetical protein
MDMICTLPLDIMFKIEGDVSWLKALKAFRIVRMMKLVRMSSLISGAYFKELLKMEFVEEIILWFQSN